MPASSRGYGAYGEPGERRGRALAGYVGITSENDTGWYLLGNRPYSPSLRRFLSTDTLSPFDRGGLNRYAYCSGDPIGRIDPGGDNWLIWLVSKIDRIELPVTTIRSSSGTESSFAMPTLLATSAFRPESRALWGTIARNATRGQIMDMIADYGNARVPLAGPDVQPARTFSRGRGIYGVQWPRVGDTASITLFTDDKRTIHIVQGPLAFHSDEKRASRAARGKVYPQWIERTNASGGIHLATTTPINLGYLRSLKNYVEHKYPGKSVTMLAGAHGTVYGDAWGADGKRLYLEQKFHDSVESKVRALKWSLTMMNYADISSEQFGSLLANGEGVFVHFTCYGAADKFFRDAFNISDITLRLLPPVPVTSNPAP